MKVLHVYKTYLPDDFTGVPRVIHSIAEGTASKGIESVVFALTKGTDENSTKVGSHTVHRVRRDVQIASTDISLRAFQAFKRQAINADVIHYHYPWPFADLLWLYAGRGKPSVVTYHSDVVKQLKLSKLYAPLRDRFLAGADAIVSTSPNYVKSSEVLSRLQRVEVIPIGIEPRDGISQTLRDKWQQRLGSGFFLFVGASRYYKGIDFLIEAANLSGQQIVLAGDADTSLQDRLPSNGVTVGKVTDADKEVLLDLCRGFVFPSHLRSEAFGVALLEASRAGKPMITCEIGTGTTFVNVDGETGIVVPPRNAQRIADAMETLARNPDLASQLGRAAKARFERYFTQEKMADHYAELYQRLKHRV